MQGKPPFSTHGRRNCAKLILVLPFPHREVVLLQEKLSTFSTYEVRSAICCLKFFSVNLLVVSQLIEHHRNLERYFQITGDRTNGDRVIICLHFVNNKIYRILCFMKTVLQRFVSYTLILYTNAHAVRGTPAHISLHQIKVSVKNLTLPLVSPVIVKKNLMRFCTTDTDKLRLYPCPPT